ncbi:cation:proton antiporter [Nocardioides convexus]|uniref:cation:proton antiporter domain-containing protein n=1 Tax=Nocardioides convexus TaxID=2712224 RepID=UPI0024184C4D|nr:cation:proton antiporter [Nocardioides convexus]
MRWSKLVIPDLHWALALAIGAVVAPPDAVAATAIGRRIGLPRRVVTILEGESLLNDASALVALRTAVAALGTTVAAWQVGLDFVIAAGGGAAIGGLAFLVVGFIRKKVTDPLLDTAISLVIPFASYIVAEEIHASGVVAVVVAGLLLGHVAPILQSAQSRIAERTNWRTIAYVLENTVFLLIGLQADWLLAEVGDSEYGASTIALACGAALLTCVVLRMVWVFAASGLLLRRGPEARTGEPMPMLWRRLVPHRLGGHARGGHPRGGVHRAGGHRPPRGAADHRVRRRGGHAARPGAHPARPGAHAAGPRPRPAGRRARPRDPAPAGGEGGHQASRRVSPPRTTTRCACGT